MAKKSKDQERFPWGHPDMPLFDEDRRYPDLCKEENPILTLRNIEQNLREFVKRRLEDFYGDEEWWSLGVPERMRLRCVTDREKDTEKHEPYKYTNLTDMRKVIIHSKNWSKIFRKHFQEKAKSSASKEEITHWLEELRGIRNIGLHGKRPLKKEEKKLIRNYCEKLKSILLEEYRK